MKHNGYCEIKIKGHKIGVLFGVRLFEVVEKCGLYLDDNPDNIMNSINIVWAGIKNNADLLQAKCDISLRDVYLFANEDFSEFSKAVECYSNSKYLGRTLKQLEKEGKKKLYFKK